MPSTTPNLGLPIPLDSDPFEDGALAMRNLANAIDTPYGNTGWTAVAFQNGWSDVGVGYQTMQYKRIGKRVYLRGTIKSGAIGSVPFTLPAGYRPPASLQFPAPSNNAYGQVTISSTGSVTVNAGSSAGVSINLTFEAA